MESMVASSTADIPGKDLTSEDKAVLKRISSPARGWSAITNGSLFFRRPDTPIADRTLAESTTCPEPSKNDDVSWYLGDVSVPEGTSGARREHTQVSWTRYDPLTGRDITCEKVVEGPDSLRLSWDGNFTLESSDSLLVELREIARISASKGGYTTVGHRTGSIRRGDGLLLAIDTFRFQESQFGFAHKKLSISGKIRLGGTPYTATLAKHEGDSLLTGDIARSSERIATFRILSDTGIEVEDMDGKPITP